MSTVEPSKSFLLGFNMEQGIGFSEFSGNWPIPEAGGGAIKILDKENKPRVIVLDSKDGRFYDITYGKHSGEEPLFTDKAPIDGEGSDIATEATFKEDRGEYEKFTIQSLANRFYVRPYDETHRGEDGYDDRGFKDGTEFTAAVYADGEPFVESAKAENLHSEEVVYDRFVEGKRLQTKFSSNKSGFQLVGRQQEFLVRDVNQNPEGRITTEGNHQEELQKDLVTWFTRSKNPDVDKVSQLEIGADIIKVNGPDNRGSSAFELQEDCLIENGGSFVMFWANGTVLSDISFTGYKSHGDWTLYYVSTTDDIDLNDGLKVFDIRIYSESKQSHLDYYFNDVVRYEADNVCPLW